MRQPHMHMDIMHMHMMVGHQLGSRQQPWRNPLPLVQGQGQGQGQG